MPELATLLREVVDASAAPVTVEEVLGLPEAVPRDRRRWPLLAAAAAVVLLAGAAAFALQGVGDDSADVVPVPLDIPTLSSCLRGCPVTDEQAATMLNLPINQPDGIPEGWALVEHDVRWWPLQEAIADYNRAWFRDPTQVGVDGITPDFVQVTVRHATPAELRPDPFTPTRRADFFLDDLTPVYGVLDGLHARLDWRADGRTYRLRASGIDGDTALAIANSLR
jgi:hypothetical protein